MSLRPGHWSLLIALWVLQLPGLDGQELSLNLHRDGQLGSFEDSFGKYKSSAVVHGRNSSLSIPFLC